MTDETHILTDPLADDGRPLPPLADPILGFIFRSEKAGGLAI